MEIALATYPWAYFTPGGGEVQIEMLHKYLNKKNINAYKFNSWKPKKKNEYLSFFFMYGWLFRFL